MKILQSIYEPIPNSAGVEGHGEGVEYNGKTYYYRVGCWIPKNKVVSLVWEGNFASRIHGDKDYIIVGYKDDDIVLLDSNIYMGIRVHMKKFQNKSVDEAILMIEQEEQAREESWRNVPNCKSDDCNNKVIRFSDEQPENLCYTCFEKTLK